MKPYSFKRAYSASELTEVVDAGAVAEVVEHVGADLADLQVEVGETEFVGDHLIRPLHFLSDFAQGLVQAEAGFHAHDHEVERVGQAEKDLLFAGAADEMESGSFM